MKAYSKYHKIEEICAKKLKLCLYIVFVSYFSSASVQQPTGNMIDQDGNTYKTVKIGDQWWMAAYLKVTHYRNGDQIPYVTDNSEWSGLTRGAYCVYDNDGSYADNCGYLYSWHAVNDSRNIAPHGWHVRTDQDWKDLEISLGMSQSDADGQKLRGRNEGGKLKAVGTSHWDSPNEGATNESGFSALPGGFRTCIKGSSSERRAFSSSLSSNAVFWSATEYNQQNAWYRYLNFNYSDVGRNFTSKKNGFSIRLVKD